MFNYLIRINSSVKPTLFILAAAACFLSFPGHAQAASLSFESAWQTVQEKSDAIAAQKDNLQRRQSLHRASMDLNLPKVSLTGNYTRLDDNITVSGDQIIESTGAGGQAALAELQGVLGHLFPPAAVAGLSSSMASLTSLASTLEEQDIFTSSIRAVWPVFTGWKITAAQEASLGRTDEARSLLDMTRQAKFEDLSKFYFGVALAQQVVDTRIAVEKGLCRHLDSARKMEAQGQIAKVERLQAEASLSKAEVDRKKAGHDLEIARLALARLLKSNSPFTLGTPLFASPSLAPLPEYLKKTLAAYPGLSLLEAREKQVQSLIKAEKSAYYPQVFLYGNYSLHERDSLTGQMTPEWLMGASINIPVFDNSGRRHKVLAAGQALSQVRRLRLQAESDLSVLVEKTYRQAEQALEEYYGLNKSMELANENLKLRKTAFSQGLSTSLDVVDAQLYLAGIITRKSAAQFNFVLSLSRLLALSCQMDRFSQYTHNDAHI